MSKQAEVTVDATNDTVRLTVRDFDRWGRLRSKRQHTFRRRQFEAALARAEMVVPWQRVER
jgi:hypothetical protein